jgi:hypothetical protein
MKKLTIALILLALAPSLGAQSTPLDACPLPANAMKVAYDEKLTVSSTALPFTRSVWRPTDGSTPAICAVVVVNSNSISWRATGATPTDVIGNITASGASFVVGAQNLPNFLMIRVTSDSVVHINYMIPAP